MRAVLFDWRGTLVHDPPQSWWVERALRTLGRDVQPRRVAELVQRIDEAKTSPDFLAVEARIDCDPALHRTANLEMFRSAGMDTALAEALYALDFDPDCHPFYPDVPEVLRQLHEAGVRTAIVSDIHFDLRPEFDQLGLASAIDEFVLSFEHGVQKPSRRIFDIALDALDVEAEQALMVGDRPSRDGCASSAGVTALILPPLNTFQPRGLEMVVSLVGSGR